MRAPYHVVAWRCLWIGPIYVAMSLVFLLTAIGWGWDHALFVWRMNFK